MMLLIFNSLVEFEAFKLQMPVTPDGVEIGHPVEIAGQWICDHPLSEADCEAIYTKMKLTGGKQTSGDIKGEAFVGAADKEPVKEGGK